jgi:hypothetical protein
MLVWRLRLSDGVSKGQHIQEAISVKRVYEFALDHIQEVAFQPEVGNVRGRLR